MPGRALQNPRKFARGSAQTSSATREAPKRSRFRAGLRVDHHREKCRDAVQGVHGRGTIEKQPGGLAHRDEIGALEKGSRWPPSAHAVNLRIGRDQRVERMHAARRRFEVARPGRALVPMRGGQAEQSQRDDTRDHARRRPAVPHHSNAMIAGSAISGVENKIDTGSAIFMPCSCRPIWAIVFCTCRATMPMPHRTVAIKANRSIPGFSSVRLSLSSRVIAAQATNSQPVGIQSSSAYIAMKTGHGGPDAPSGRVAIEAPGSAAGSRAPSGRAAT